MDTLAIVAALAIPLVAAAQFQPTQVTVGPDPACATCRIELTKVVTLGRPTDSLTPFGAHLSVVRNAKGEYIVGPSTSYSLIVYDANGRQVRSVGRRGPGPGEFRTTLMNHIAGRGDTLFVFEWLPGRVSVFRPDLTFVGETRPELVMRKSVVRMGGGFLGSAALREPDRVGLPLHIVNDSGRIVRSFGSATRQARPDLPNTQLRVVARAGEQEQAVWAARLEKYELELWTAGGVHRQTIVRRAPWFPAWDGGPLRDVGKYPPHPSVRGLAVDSIGRLWVSVQVPETRWAARTDSSRGVTPLAEESRYVDTVLDLIDVRTGKLTASLRTGDALYPLTNNLFWSCRDDADGKVFIDVWRADSKP
jgi:hypothetical protein